MFGINADTEHTTHSYIAKKFLKRFSQTSANKAMNYDQTFVDPVPNWASELRIVLGSKSADKTPQSMH